MKFQHTDKICYTSKWFGAFVLFIYAIGLVWANRGMLPNMNTHQRMHTRTKGGFMEASGDTL